MLDRLSLDDDRLFPVQAFFNAVPDSWFVEIVRRLRQGIGAHINDAHCQFPDDLDPGEERFDGVRFSLFEESVVLTLQEFQQYLCEASASYLATHPEDAAKLANLLSSS